MCGRPGRRYSPGRCASARGWADESLLRTDIDRLRGRIEVNVWIRGRRSPHFTQAAEQVARHGPIRALEMAVIAALAQSARTPAENQRQAVIALSAKIHQRWMDGQDRSAEAIGGTGC
jgi:hypothetical protein